MPYVRQTSGKGAVPMSSDLPPLESTQSGRSLSLDQLASFRVAAYFFFAQVGIGILLAALLNVSPPFAELVIYLLLAFFLYWPNAATRTVTLFMAILTTALRSSVLFSKMPLTKILILSLPTWGLTISLLVLLPGHAVRARRIAAICIFCLFNALLVSLAIISRFGR
jgi:hypothetical protein